jgi:hypothetical protein
VSCSVPSSSPKRIRISKNYVELTTVTTTKMGQKTTKIGVNLRTTPLKENLTNNRKHQKIMNKNRAIRKMLKRKTIIMAIKQIRKDIKRKKKHRR